MKKIGIVLIMAMMLSTQVFAQSKIIPVMPSFTGGTKGFAFYTVAPEVFVGLVFGIAYAIGGKHWNQCKIDFPDTSDPKRAACQAELNFPQTWFAKLGKGNAVVPVEHKGGYWEGRVLAKK